MLTYFIADLHLTQEREDITDCFLSFLRNEAPKAEKLYILGDFFEFWVGDDDDDKFVLDIAAQLKVLSANGTDLFFIVGNRDFLLGKKYAKKAGMTLLPDIQVIDLYGTKAVIMHGDSLCTNDLEYMKFRKKSRSWWWQTIVRCLPLSTRKNMARKYRAKVAMRPENHKPQEIMDVTPIEVVKTLEQYNSQLMIHGHTHRPDVHQLSANGKDAQRIVLGDWYEQGSYLKVTENGFELLNQTFE
ncbi:UDP-2,3-diacylglucosamine diphosphatase [Thalassotalea psychrophila]|uniref:UDP-2,3-diacylglucosamine hydrolase n=1 Tax=Thalassotalea psychrophila TaxID=3065647 RepID=A0ABY9TXC7_9GAMM|nr:UDP-2,3-diacylglucosamine diphosphatase [Colwelliaceae bacterium SQ149]